MKLTKCTIHTQSFDAKMLDTFCNNIINTLSSYKHLNISGPIMLPTHIKKITVNRSPHIDKKSREQFEIRTYTRATQIALIDQNEDLIKALQQVKKELPIGLDIKVVFTYSTHISL